MSDRYIIRTTGQTGPVDTTAQTQLAAHLADTNDAHDASAISFSATGNLSATDVQAAIAELDSEKAAVAEPIAAAHIGDGTDAHDASAISVLDTAGNWTATDVEGVLAEIPTRFLSATSRYVQAPSVDVVGHSYVAGTGATTSADRLANRIAAGLGLTLDSVGTSGSALGWQGEWADKHLRAITPAARQVNRVHVLMYGINDINGVGNTTANLLGFRHALRSVISRRRSILSVEESDSSFSFSSFVGNSADTTRNTGTGWQYATSGSATYTITTPAWFPGGTLGIRILTRNPANEGAIHTATYNGTPYALNCLNTWGGTPVAAPCTLRIPDVAPGVQTISVALSSLSTLTAVDGWQLEPDSGPRPLIVLIKQPRLPAYSAYNPSTYGPPTDTGVDNLNAIIDAVAAEFDDYVITVDTSGINSNASYFIADKLHPNDAGHAYIADQTLAAIAAAGFIIGSD